MSYFLKKTKTKKGLYLQIYFSYRDKAAGGQPRNRSIQALGFERDLIESGIEDPIAYGKEIAAQLNEEWRAQKEDQKTRRIEQSPVRYLGYFPLLSILRRMDVKKYLDVLQINRNFEFSLYELLSALVFARAVKPCSKKKTVEEVLPSLWDSPAVSYDQTLSGIEFMGRNYEKIVEVFTKQTHETYILDTSTTYFDCTNFYFEIDREDDFRRKGPSKERRADPLVGMGLLLDKNCIPIGMRLYPGNQSEKPIIRDLIHEMKDQQNITGKTVRVADKGLNCTKNIVQAATHGDGYLFSRSVNNLGKEDRAWVLDSEGYHDVFVKKDKDEKNRKNVNGETDKKDELLFSYKSIVKKVPYEYTNDTGRKFKITLKEKRIAIFNPALARKKREEINKMALKAENCCLSEAKKKEYGQSSKYVIFESIGEDGKKTGKKVGVSLNEEKIQKDLAMCGYNMLITSEVDMDDTEIYQTYHQLWRIEESFRSLKSELDARPVYHQNPDSIKGHFLICYLTLLLVRLFQFKILDNKFGTHEVFEFLTTFQVVKTNEHEILNITPRQPIIEYLSQKYHLPLLNYILKPSQVKKVLEF